MRPTKEQLLDIRNMRYKTQSILWSSILNRKSKKFRMCCYGVSRCEDCNGKGHTSIEVDGIRKTVHKICPSCINGRLPAYPIGSIIRFACSHCSGYGKISIKGYLPEDYNQYTSHTAICPSCNGRRDKFAVVRSYEGGTGSVPFFLEVETLDIDEAVRETL